MFLALRILIKFVDDLASNVVPLLA